MTAHDVVAAGQEHGNVEILADQRHEPVADPAGSGTEVTDHPATGQVAACAR